MNSYRKYNYEPYEESIQVSNKKSLKKVQRIKKHAKKKINYFKVIILSVLAIFVLKPCATNIYDYTFFNSIRNSKIKVQAEGVVNNASGVLANTHFLGRNFIGNVANKKPLMTQLELNNEMTTLKANIEFLLKQYPNLQAGVFVWDYQTHNYVSINGEMQTSAASIIKVPILLQMFKRIETTDLDLYEKFKMTSYYRTGGQGIYNIVPKALISR